nr:probable glutathione S-transferase [Tanacetum cinerariifolium]
MWSDRPDTSNRTPTWATWYAALSWFLDERSGWKKLDGRSWTKEAGRKRLDGRGWTEEAGRKRLDGRGWTEEAGRKRLDGRGWTEGLYEGPGQMTSDGLRVVSSTRVKIALSIKRIKYENIEENLENKSADLLKYNPVHKKVPVLVHNGNPINESLVIVEYIDDVWKGVPLLPQDAYKKAVARFWAKFIDDKCIPALYRVFGSHGDEQAIAEACEQLQILENELKVKGTKFFGGENINIVDIAADFIAYWLGIIEEATEIKFVTKEKFPKIHEWADNFINSQAVKEILPPRKHMLAYYRKRFGKA